jgi:putative ABC transport system permease protein
VERWDAISPEYFDVFQIRLVRGRLFTDRDTRAGRPVAIINEAMARQLWPGGDPLRDHILLGQGAGPSFEEPVPRAIVGIVANVRQLGLDRPAYPGVYVPFAQTTDALMAFFNGPGVSATWAIRTRSAPELLANAAARELLAATQLPAANIRTMEDIVQSATAPRALNTWLMTAFGGLALWLAVIGIYAMAAYSVQQRTHEFGIRMALGAQSRDVRHLVVWESLRVTLVGLLVGWFAAVGLARVLGTLLFGITTHDPATFVVVPIALVMAAVIGAWIPASRAACLDPLGALRSD